VLEIPREAEERVKKHLALVLKWGKAMNLTGAKTEKELREEHVADALPLASLLPQGARLLDVGSGAGFPGVILGIVRPDLTLTFLEKNHKKAVFLRTATRETWVKAKVEEGDAEQPPTEMEGAFDAVVARAVFPPERWVHIGERFVAPGGRLYALLAEAAPPRPPETLVLEASHPYTLPGGAKRTIAVYRRQTS